MPVRSIYDECGGIVPFAVRRIDGISATAIRAGAKGMTTEGVGTYINQLKTDSPAEPATHAAAESSS
jgi:hypothetical protein